MNQSELSQLQDHSMLTTGTRVGVAKTCTRPSRVQTTKRLPSHANFTDTGGDVRRLTYRGKELDDDVKPPRNADIGATTKAGQTTYIHQ